MDILTTFWQYDHSLITLMFSCAMELGFGFQMNMAHTIDGVVGA